MQEMKTSKNIFAYKQVLENATKLKLKLEIPQCNKEARIVD